MKPRLVDAAGLALGYKPEKPRIKRLNGGAERDRTVGLLNAIQALSQLSYSPTKIKNNTAQNVLSNQICLLFIPISLVGRRWTRGPSFFGIDIRNPFSYSCFHAGVVKLVDARDSKSREPQAHVGSIPTSGTNYFSRLQIPRKIKSHTF